jgi:hypothetical protein
MNINIDSVNSESVYLVKIHKDMNSIVSTIHQNQLINIYPNPASNIITIEFKQKTNEKIYQLFDSTGKLMLQEPIRNTIIMNLSDFITGIYFLKIGSNSYKIVVN